MKKKSVIATHYIHQNVDYIEMAFIWGATGSDMVATVDYHSSGGYENLRGGTPLVE